MKRLMLLAIFVAAPLAAQSGAGRAANTITPPDVARRIGIIAHDSMMGRDTPSPGLEMTARYVASEFKRFGLKPGGDSGTYIQRYPITRKKLDVANSSIFFQGDAEIPVSFAEDAYVLFGEGPSQPITGEMVLIGGVVDPSQIHAADVKDKVVIWPVDFTKPTPGRGGQVVNALFAAGARLLVVISNRDSVKFASELKSRLGERVSFGTGESQGGPLVIEVRDEAITSVFPAAAEQFAQARSAATMIVQDASPWTATLNLRQQVVGTDMAPNTIGILEGSDPALKNEYLVYSAHMDHIGITSGQPDSISNGADDDGSGTAGVLELAEAFSQRNARPKRSIVFITVSGEEKGLWGSSYFADHPTVPIKDVVADLNIDMIGRNWKDTIVVIGMQHSDLGTTLAGVGESHRDLRMTPIDDIWPEEGLYFRSDHYNFAKKGVPILFFTSGLHDDYHRVTDSAEKIDSEKESRILKLLFFLGQDIANNPTRPQWKPESYKEIVEQANSTP